MMSRSSTWIALSITTLALLGLLVFLFSPAADVGAEAVSVDASFSAIVLPPPEPGQQAPAPDEEVEEVDEDEDVDVDEVALEEEAEDEPAELERSVARAEPDPPKTSPEPRTMSSTRRAKARKWKPAVLQVVTNFGKADVTVNGLQYPEYFEPGSPEGMVLPAGGPYHVIVSFDGKSKEYRVHLRPNETRLLLVELSGYQSGAPPAPKPAAKAPPPKEEKPEEKPDPKAPGRITVYSKPAGKVIVDGNNTSENTPGTVELENGRHEVQVQYESGTVSEKKIVRVRTGSRIKLFFRERNTNN